VVLLTEKQTVAETFYPKQGLQARAKTVFIHQKLEGEQSPEQWQVWH
jgi:hypothetical protein